MYLKVLYSFGLLLLIRSYASRKIYSFVSNNIINSNDPESFLTTLSNTEKLFLQSALRYTATHDTVCNLNDEKKIELCRIIFEIKFYKYLPTYLNNTAFFMTKLPCLEKYVTLKQSHPNWNKNDKILTRMYPCYGRHDIIRTSFIEDDHYNKFYVSAGPDINSVTVLSYVKYRTHNEINVYDHIYNVNFSKLDDKIISKRDVISELKLNNKIYVTSDLGYVEKVYDIAQQNYSEKDPICDLPYEKKITLCKLLFDQPIYEQHNIFHLILNKAATYLLDMTCTTKPVYRNLPNNETQLQSKQKMYPCYARNQIIESNNVLEDPYAKKLFVSGGHTRNSLFVYLRTIQNSFTEKYTVIKMLENVNMFRLQPTIITIKELKEESETTYFQIQDMLQTNERDHYDEFLQIITRAKPEEIEKEEEMINQMLQNAVLSYEKIIEKARKIQRAEIEKSIAEYRQHKSSDSTVNIANISSINKQMLQKNVKEQLLKQLFLMSQEDVDKVASIDFINFADFLQIGPQSFKRILDKMRAEIESETTVSYFKSGSYEPIVTKAKKRDPKLNNEMQKLIKGMEKFVINRDVQVIYNWANIDNKKKQDQKNETKDIIKKKQKKHK